MRCFNDADVLGAHGTTHTPNLHTIGLTGRATIINILIVREHRQAVRSCQPSHSSSSSSISIGLGWLAIAPEAKLWCIIVAVVYLLLSPADGRCGARGNDFCCVTLDVSIMCVSYALIRIRTYYEVPGSKYSPLFIQSTRKLRVQLTGTWYQVPGTSRCTTCVSFVWRQELRDASNPLFYPYCFRYCRYS